MLRTRQTCFALACLALGALCVPALSDPPATVSAAPVVQPTAQKIVLQNVLPGDLIKALHWDQAAHLPAGVTQVLPLPTQNALAVTAAPDGFAKVQEMVKVLDIAPRLVQVKFALAYVSEAGLQAAGLSSSQYATGFPVVKFLQTLTQQKATSASTSLTTTNDISAGETLFYGPTTPLSFAVTPHMNSDHSLALTLDAAVPGSIIKHEVHSVQSGDTLVIIKPLANPGAEKRSLLLFVTPTLK